MPTVAVDLVSHIPYLRWYGRRIAGNGDVADDLVQQTLEKALRALADYRPLGNLQAWLVTIMRNEFRSRYRAEQRRAAWVVRAARGKPPQAPAQFDTCLLHELERVIGRMPKTQRAVLTAVCFEGCTYTQASALLAIPIGTVRSRMARARATLSALAAVEPAVRTDGDAGGVSRRDRIPGPAVASAGRGVRGCRAA
jgi:RNA polymerase sigma-70 factor (ECF subfamily)